MELCATEMDQSENPSLSLGFFLATNEERLKYGERVQKCVKSPRGSFLKKASELKLLPNTSLKWCKIKEFTFFQRTQPTLHDVGHPNLVIFTQSGTP